MVGVCVGCLLVPIFASFYILEQFSPLRICIYSKHLIECGIKETKEV